VSTESAVVKSKFGDESLMYNNILPLIDKMIIYPAAIYDIVRSSLHVTLPPGRQ
jgi:hypothetical protein